jgi:hypothetical protein
VSVGRKTFTVVVTFGFLVLTLSAGLAVLLWQQTVSPSEVSLTLQQGAPGFLLWRIVVFGTLIAYWDRVVHWLAQGFRLTPDQRLSLINARWRVADWLVVMEALLGQNLVGECLRLLAGSA